MKDFLKKILDVKREEVDTRKRETPLAELTDRCHDQETARGFGKALNLNGEIAVVAEIKKASPSAGVLREEFEPEAVAREYADHGAGAISVLTEQHFFQGSLLFLHRVRQVVETPLLCKDFVIDPYQVVEARAYGADAVLLIVAALEKEQLAELFRLTVDLGMDALVEVHSEAELRAAHDLGARLIGINNRDLTTFEVDTGTAPRLAALAGEGVTVLAESGIKTRSDVEALSGTGIDAVLIGESLMRSDDIGAALEQFVGVPK